MDGLVKRIAFAGACGCALELIALGLMMATPVRAQDAANNQPASLSWMLTAATPPSEASLSEAAGFDPGIDSGFDSSDDPGAVASEFAFEPANALWLQPNADAGLTSDTNQAPAATYSDNDWVHRWLRAVDKARSEQPHYVAPLITTHVLLVQQFRYDSYQQAAPTGAISYNFGAGKGLEIIPNTRMEVQVGLPTYIMHEAPHMPDGFGDVSIFLKFRAFSAPEGRGDYFVGIFLGGTFPTGTPPIGMGHTVWSPMLAAAKGWRGFDLQSTLSGNLPQSGTLLLGRQILFNNTVQYAIKKKLWPEIETNSEFFMDGPDSGKTQSFLTPGLLIGPFDIAERLHFEPGGGVQIAVTQFHQYDHRWIWTLRFPF